MPAIAHHLAIDLEEHFQSDRVRSRIPQRYWDRFSSRLEQNTDHALQLIEDHGARASFVVDKWTAKRHSVVVDKVAQRGHEIVCRLDSVDEAESTKQMLELVTGRCVHGCRVGSQFSANAASTLAQHGFKYMLTSRFAADQVALRSIRQAKHTTGERLRLIPEVLVNYTLARWNQREPLLFRFGIWELDPDLPRLSILSALDQLRFHRNLDVFAGRVSQLLEGASFRSLSDSFGIVDTPVVRHRLLHAAEPLQEKSIATGEAVSIVIPCFNEEAVLPYLFNALQVVENGFGSRHKLEFLLVDDGSTDATWDEMQRLSAENESVQIIRHGNNRGIGAAIVSGIAAAQHEIVAVIDSDCSYDPARIEDMISLLKPDVAIVTGSPYHPLGGVDGVSGWRLILSRSASRLYRMLLHNKLATYTSCFRVYRKSALKNIVVRHAGYIGVVEMLARVDLEGWKIAEYPIVLEARLLGRSKIRILRVIAEHLHFLYELSRTRLSTRTATLKT